mmetsp:Transcript_7266/g.12706  ORF Transcript_7266/g.12706 Transcript_7266/m.12706 type:complete len:114 (+) Transcript_7266:422-763(+)
MRKAILIMALTLAVSGCLTIGSTFQRWIGTYEYDDTSYRVALVQTDGLGGETHLEYHLVPGTTTTYRNSDMIARCLAADGPGEALASISTCERPFARAIDALLRPTMQGSDYG